MTMTREQDDDHADMLNDCKTDRKQKGEKVNGEVEEAVSVVVRPSYHHHHHHVISII